jgi:UDP-glucose 4-epimerase
VLASSAAVYGDTRHAVAESAPLRPLGVYGRSKALAEGVVAGAPSGLVSSTLRLFNVYGPGQADDPPAAVIPAAIRAARTGEEFPLRGDGGQQRDFVHVDDVVGAVIASLGARSSATLNVGTGRGETVSAVLDVVEACTGRSIRRVRSPLLPGEIESSVAIVDALRLSYPGLRFRPLRAGLRGMLSRETETLPAMTVH